MIKLPKCPHCEKLLVAIIGDNYVPAGNVSYDNPRHERNIVYLCPEKMIEKKPDWVEVLET